MGILKFLAKRVLPVVAGNLVLDIDTIKKEKGQELPAGNYFRIRVEVFGRVIIDRHVNAPDNVNLDLRIPPL